jgi:hypothetical protein
VAGAVIKAAMRTKTVPIFKQRWMPLRPAIRSIPSRPHSTGSSRIFCTITQELHRGQKGLWFYGCKPLI